MYIYSIMTDENGIVILISNEKEKYLVAFLLILFINLFWMNTNFNTINDDDIDNDDDSYITEELKGTKLRNG